MQPVHFFAPVGEIVNDAGHHARGGAAQIDKIVGHLLCPQLQRAVLVKFIDFAHQGAELGLQKLHHTGVHHQALKFRPVGFKRLGQPGPFALHFFGLAAEALGHARENGLDGLARIQPSVADIAQLLGGQPHFLTQNVKHRDAALG